MARARCERCRIFTDKPILMGRDHFDPPKVICKECGKSWHKTFDKEMGIKAILENRYKTDEEFKRAWKKLFLKWFKGVWSVS